MIDAVSFLANAVPTTEPAAEVEGALAPLAVEPIAASALGPDTPHLAPDGELHADHATHRRCAHLEVLSAQLQRTATAGVAAATPVSDVGTAHRLPNHFLQRAIAVDLDLTHVDIDAPADGVMVPGKVSIEGALRLGSRRLELSARDLRVHGAKVFAGGRVIEATVEPRADLERIVLKVDEELPPGPVRLELEYEAALGSHMHGLYLGADGPERALVTQCEATDARAIFPCLDEPAYKTSIAWTLRTRPGFEVVANGPLESALPDAGGNVVHTFAATRDIPTYLAAFTVGRYDATAEERLGRGRTPSRLYAGRGKLAQTAFAAKVTRFVIDAYESYFKMAFPFAKLAQVAVPGFDAGAMENPGAIFYRQTALLVDEERAAVAAVRRVAEVVAHEIAHQWFGNEVTPAWWDDLWLNEAFATWISHKMVDAMRPDLRMWDMLLAGKEAALRLDALHTTHPIYTPVDTPAQAVENFDAITYEKGSSVLRMMELYLGDEVWRRGVAAYIHEHRGGNATGADLWNAIGEAAAQPVDELIRTWVERPGFPVVAVEVEPRADKTVLRLAQRRFLADDPAGDDSPPWPIPLALQYDDGSGPKTHRLLFAQRQAEIELPAGVRWVYPNAGGVGVYRSQLEGAALAALLRHGLPQLSPAERIGLLHDTWALVKNGSARVGTLLDLLAALKSERDVLVVQAMGRVLGELEKNLVDEASRPRFAAFTRDLLAGQLETLGWEAQPGEDAARKELRGSVVSTLGRVGADAVVLRKAEELERVERQDAAAVEANLASAVVGLAASRGDTARLRSFVGAYLQRKQAGLAPQVQNRYLDALTRFEDPAAVREIFRLAVAGTIPQEQLTSVIGGLLRNPKSQKLAWELLRGQWGTIGGNAGDMGVSRLVEALADLPPRCKDEVRDFFAAHPVPTAARTLEQTVEALGNRDALARREADNLATWLARRAAGAAAG